MVQKSHSKTKEEKKIIDDTVVREEKDFRIRKYGEVKHGKTNI